MYKQPLDIFKSTGLEKKVIGQYKSKDSTKEKTAVKDHFRVCCLSVFFKQINSDSHNDKSCELAENRGFTYCSWILLSVSA